MTALLMCVHCADGYKGLGIKDAIPKLLAAAEASELMSIPKNNISDVNIQAGEDWMLGGFSDMTQRAISYLFWILHRSKHPYCMLGMLGYIMLAEGLSIRLVSS